MIVQESQISSVLEEIEKEDKVAVDTETTGLNCVGGKDTCIGVSIAAVIGDTPVSAEFGNFSTPKSCYRRRVGGRCLYVLSRANAYH